MDGPTIEPPNMIPIWIKDIKHHLMEIFAHVKPINFYKVSERVRTYIQLNVHERGKNKCLKHGLLCLVVSVVLFGEERGREHDTKV